MKNIFLFIAAILLWSSCKKVDEHAVMVKSQPWFADHYTQFNGTHMAPIDWTYPKDVVVGDTIMLIGKLFPTVSGTSITIGGVPVTIQDTARLTMNATFYSPQDPIDAIRFVVTKEMGVGPNRKVCVTANGVTAYGPPINIKLINSGNMRTDTTRWVDEIATWKPTDMAAYSSNNYSLLYSVSNDKNGNIYFQNSLGVQSLINGQFTSLYQVGANVKDDKGNSFTFQQFIGSAVAFDGDYLYISAETKENSTDATDNYIFRLCKLNLASKQLTTINRTLVKRVNATVAEKSFSFQGNVSSLKIVAMILNTDVNGTLYYTNAYAEDNLTDNHSFWHNGIASGSVGDYPFECVNEISAMTPDGNCRGLMYSSLYSKVKGAGFTVITGQYIHDPMGNNLYSYWTTNWIQYNIVQYNLADDSKGFSFPPYLTSQFTMRSFENDPKYKMTNSGGFWLDGFDTDLNRCMILTDGTLLTSGQRSLYSYDLFNKNYYCYAGVENGVNTANPEQNQTIGRAKWVDFTDTRFIGQDKSGAVYYFNYHGDAYTNGVKFYKLYPKKQ